MVNNEIENLILSTQQKWADIVLKIGEASKQKVNLRNKT